MKQEPTHVIVTGGSSGIGEATTKELLRRGNRVTVFDLQESSLSDAHSQIVDLSKENQVSQAVLEAEQRFGKATGLIACHGVRGAYAPTLEIDLDSMRRLYEIHVIGTVSVCREFVKRLDGKSGSIVLVSSTTAYGGWVNQIDYGPAKAAVSQVTKNLAVEWAPLGVRVNAIAPGHTLTKMVQDMVDQDGYDLSEVENRMPLGRLADPSEMAEALIWLLQDATFVTGQCLPVDGGWTVPGK